MNHQEIPAAILEKITDCFCESEALTDITNALCLEGLSDRVSARQLLWLYNGCLSHLHSMLSSLMNELDQALY